MPSVARGLEAKALTPPASHSRFPLFDSLRALAAISILIVHCAIFTGGFENFYGPLVAHLDIGVPVFFLLSAFLLYRPFVAERVLGDPGKPLRVYAKRRFMRIAPAYWAALTVSAIVPGLAGAFSGNWWVYYGLLQNYPIYTPTGTCATDTFRCGLPPTWSLAVEVAFYAMLPLLVLLMAWVGRRLKGRAWFLCEMIAVLVISVVSVLILATPLKTDLNLWLFFSPLGRGYWFALGLGLAAFSVWVQRRDRVPRFTRFVSRRSWLFAITAVALYVIACETFLGPSPSLAAPVGGQREFVAENLLFGAIAAILLLPAIFGKDEGGLYRRALGHRSLTWLGLVSYGVFLWQFPVLIFLLDAGILDLWPKLAFPILILATLAGTVACAAISYYVIERPLLRRSHRRSRSGEVESHPALAESDS